ncbi:hypothetical protein [Rothia sp. P4278]|uniref:hypothetical protein n=1 Tax=Rothia sp. P4278 TaxID=3402658 RepID=UPI003AE0F3CC
MGIFRRRSRYSSQTDSDDVSLLQRFREDFSQSSELVERLGAWIGDSRGRIAIFGLLTFLLVVGFLLVTILIFGMPSGVEKDFKDVNSSAELSHLGQHERDGLVG